MSEALRADLLVLSLKTLEERDREKATRIYEWQEDYVRGEIEKSLYESGRSFMHLWRQHCDMTSNSLDGLGMQL